MFIFWTLVSNEGVHPSFTLSQSLLLTVNWWPSYLDINMSFTVLRQWWTILRTLKAAVFNFSLTLFLGLILSQLVAVGLRHHHVHLLFRVNLWLIVPRHLPAVRYFTSILVAFRVLRAIWLFSIEGLSPSLPCSRAYFVHCPLSAMSTLFGTIRTTLIFRWTPSAKHLWESSRPNEDVPSKWVPPCTKKILGAKKGDYPSFDERHLTPKINPRCS